MERRVGFRFVAWVFVAGWACVAAWPSVLAACSSDDAPADADGGEETGVVPQDLCAKWTEAGAPCAPISNVVCFSMCTNGGCRCQGAPGDPSHGVWSCTTDLSCVPESGPFDRDTEPPPPPPDASDAGGAG